MNKERIRQLRTELEDERIDLVELSEIEEAFAQIPTSELRDQRENAMASDMLDELEAWACRFIGTRLNDEEILDEFGRTYLLADGEEPGLTRVDAWKGTEPDAEENLCEGCADCDIPGVRDHADNGLGLAPPEGYVIVERCDACEHYGCDMEAAEQWGDDAREQTVGDVSQAIARPPRQRVTLPSPRHGIKTIPFSITRGKLNAKGRIEVGGHGIEIFFDGYGTMEAPPEHGGVLFIEPSDDGHPAVYAWTDIQLSDVTHAVHFDAAAESLRLPDEVPGDDPYAEARKVERPPVEVGQRRRFYSTLEGADSKGITVRHYSGQEVEIMSVVPDDEFDEPDHEPMFMVRAADGVEFAAWEGEVNDWIFETKQWVGPRGAATV